MDYLPFEQPIADLEAEIDELESQQNETAEAVELLRKKKSELSLSLIHI